MNNDHWLGAHGYCSGDNFMMIDIPPISATELEHVCALFNSAKFQSCTAIYLDLPLNPAVRIHYLDRAVAYRDQALRRWELCEQPLKMFLGVTHAVIEHFDEMVRQRAREKILGY
jgi:hypothetical protein